MMWSHHATPVGMGCVAVCLLAAYLYEPVRALCVLEQLRSPTHSCLQCIYIINARAGADPREKIYESVFNLIIFILIKVNGPSCP